VESGAPNPLPEAQHALEGTETDELRRTEAAAKVGRKT
jgi:hypothetical protein